MHMRIGSLRQACVAVVPEAAKGMGEGLLQSGAHRKRAAAPARRLTERTLSARAGEQHESLIVQLKNRFYDAAVEVHHRCNRSIGGNEMLAQIAKRMLRRVLPGAVPAQPAGFAIRIRHARDGARPVRLRVYLAVEADCLMESASIAISGEFPP